MNKKLILSLLSLSLFSIINDALILETEASNISKNQEDLSPHITYTTEQIGDREKMRVNVTVEDKSGSGIKEFRDYNNNLINGNSYTFEITKRGEYIFSVVDNNNQSKTIKIDDSWVNPYSNYLSGREFQGSGYWTSSNMREWLNSSQDTVNYTCNPPNKEFMGNNAYDMESGFLNQFTKEELDAIAITQRRILVSRTDSIARTINIDKGELSHLNTMSSSFISNFNNYSYGYKSMGAKTENDKVFLLQPHELYWYLYIRDFKIPRNLTEEAKLKHNLKSLDGYGWWIQWDSSWAGYNRLATAGDGIYAIAQRYADAKKGVVPAIHLKPDYILSNSVKASNLKIGDTITFGKYLNAPIEWQVINISNEGYPLLLSTKELDLKQFDAKGDMSRIYSDYISFDSYDVSLVDDVEYKPLYSTSDKNIPVMIISNIDELNIRQNNPYSLDFVFEDDESGIDYIELPNGNKIFTEEFSYEFSSNNDYLIKSADNAGNYNEYLIPVYNINAEPSVIIDTSKDLSKWSNTDIVVDINTSNEVVYRKNDFYSTSLESAISNKFPNYISYAGQTFKIKASLKLDYLSPDINPNNYYITFGSYFKNKKYNPYGYSSENYYDNAYKVYLKDISSDEYVDFEFDYKVPNNYSHSLSAYSSNNIIRTDGEKYRIHFKEISYQLINDNSNDFSITSIILSNSNEIFDNKYTDTVSDEGINTLTYKVLDSRGKETTKTITTKIDKTSPTLNLDYDKSTEITTQNIVVSINASDSLSGFKRIKLPNGNYITNSNSTYTITGDGEYTFECEDVAGNITTKTIAIDNIDKEKPNVSIDKNDNWTNKPVQININAID